MKGIHFMLVVLCLISTQIMGQEIHFQSISDGQIITNYTNYSSTQSTIPVNSTMIADQTDYPLLSIKFAKVLITHEGQYDGRTDDLPEWFNLAPGTYTWTAQLWEVFIGSIAWQKTAERTVTFHVKHTITVKNIFEQGTIILDGAAVNSGTETHKFIGDHLGVGAIDQWVDNYYRKWNTEGSNLSNWQRRAKNQSPELLLNSNTRHYTYYVNTNDNGASIIAELKKVVNLNFQNILPGNSSSGTIKVNGSSYNSPKNVQALEGDHLTFQALTPQIFNYIQYNFQQWNDGHTVISRAIDPTLNRTFTAQFKGKALFPEDIRNLNYDFSRNDRIILHWSEHPNSNVTKYAIWRKVQDNGVMLPPQQVTIVNRGTTTCYDIMFKANMNGVDMIWYDVRPYFAPDGTWGDENWGEGIRATQINFDKENTEDFSEVLNYFTGSYPNPFNPATTITYHLPKEGHVTLKVYNSIGREIVALVDENKGAGKYTVEFNAASLASGIYFYEIRVDEDYSAIRKMLLIK